eukprot:6319792-Pyramimonas_sp.AAC.1
MSDRSIQDVRGAVGGLRPTLLRGQQETLVTGSKVRRFEGSTVKNHKGLGSNLAELRVAPIYTPTAV